MTTLESYLRQTLGIKATKKLYKSDNSVSPSVNSRNFFSKKSEIVIHGVSVLVVDLQPDSKITVSKIIAEYKELKDIHSRPILIELSAIDSATRKLLIGNRVNFVVPGQQLYFPEIYISLKESGLIKSFKPKTLSIPAQVLLLYHMQRKSLADISLSDIATTIGYSLKTISLVATELSNFGIATVINRKDRTKSLSFFNKGIELWKQVAKYMQNPIVRDGRTYDDISFLNPAKCGMSVLNQNYRDYHAYGITLNEARKNDIRLYLKNGNKQVYLWRYDPRVIADADGYADILSTVLWYRSSPNDLMEKIVSKVQWADL